MAPRTSAAPRSSVNTVTNAEHTAFKAGDKVEWNGKLAKVVSFGYQELPTMPGQDAAFDDKLTAHLQLPAETPGGEPGYARFVPVEEITVLKDNPKRQRALEAEFNPLFGEPAPLAEAPEQKAPEIKKPGSVTKSGTEGVAKISRPPVDLARTPAAEGKTVVTGPAEKPKSAKSKSKGKK